MLKSSAENPALLVRPSGTATSVLALVAAVLLVACNDAAVRRPPSATGTGGSAAPSSPGTGGGGSSGNLALPDAAPATPDAPATADVAACTPTTCTPPGGRYCGAIGDGCRGTLACGDDCPMGQTCGGGGVKNLCGAPVDPNCKPITCMQAGGRLCGRVGNGCGGELLCGECPGGEMCSAGVCGGAGTPGAPVCDNLCAQRAQCAAGQETTLTGVVYAPTPAKFGAADPLYNALVYIPNRAVAPFPTSGVACDLCGTAVSGAPIVTALTGSDGKFTLRNVPAGDNIPLVIQIGRWRRQVTIPKVAACTSTPLPAELTRLPRNRMEGDIPQMAIATGQYDAMECLLRKIGIDDAEFTPPTGPGRVHVYTYPGATRLPVATPSGDRLVQSPTELAKYDIVLLPCHSEDQKLDAELTNLRDYAGKGGRLFLTDFSYSWLRDQPAPNGFEGTAKWLADPPAVGDDFDTKVDQSFPKGQAFAEWLSVVKASTQMGVLPIHDPYGGVSYFDGVTPPTQRWLYTEAPLESTVQHFTFNTPVGTAPDKQCGRVVFSTFHVAEGSDDSPFRVGGGTTFPLVCLNGPMTPQEKALEFMLFDASSCIIPDTERPTVFQPPPPAPPPPPPVVE